MGSWNSTDTLTQLPIHYGDKIKCFVLQQQPYEFDLNGTCYSNDLWSPIGPPVTGIYNDYGSISKIEKSLNAEIILNELRNSDFKIKTDKFDKKISLKKTKLETLLSCIERGRIKTTHKDPMHLGMMFVLEETYKAMLSFNPVDMCHHTNGKGYYYAPITTYLQRQIESWYESQMVLFKATKDEFRLSLSDSRLFGSFRTYGQHAFKPKLIELIKEDVSISDSKVQNIFKNIVDLMHFDYSMSHARKMYQPQTGAGSQNDNTAVHAALAKATLDVVAKRKAQWDEENEPGEEPDEEGYYPYMRTHNKLQIFK